MDLFCGYLFTVYAGISILACMQSLHAKVFSFFKALSLWRTKHGLKYINSPIQATKMKMKKIKNLHKYNYFSFISFKNFPAVIQVNTVFFSRPTLLSDWTERRSSPWCDSEYETDCKTIPSALVDTTTETHSKPRMAVW